MKYLLVILTVVAAFQTQSIKADCTTDLRFLLLSTKKIQKKVQNITGIQLKEEINKIENTIDLFRLRKENAEPAIHLYYKKYIAEIDAHLMSENFSVAHRVVRSLFRDMEFAFAYVKEISPYYNQLKYLSDELLANNLETLFKELKYSQLEIDLLKAGSRNPQTGKELVLQLAKDINEQQIFIARHYQGYFLFRNHLEQIANNGDLKTKRMLDTLGMRSETEQIRFPDFFIGHDRPSLGDFQKLVYSNPYMDLIRLKVERNFEIFQAIKSLLLQPQFLDSIFRGIINIPGMHKTKVVRLFKYIYNTQARELYFPKINRVIRTQGITAKERVGLLRELNSTTEADDLLITFARRVDTKATEAWDAISKTAKESYPDFATKMDKAVEKAKARGPISSTFKKSHVGKLAILLTTGGTISYFYISPESIPTGAEITVTELPVDESSETSHSEDRDNVGELPETNSTKDGITQEPYFPNTTQARESFKKEIHEEDSVNLFDENIEKDLQALESFTLGNN